MAGTDTKLSFHGDLNLEPSPNYTEAPPPQQPQPPHQYLPPPQYLPPQQQQQPQYMPPQQPQQPPFGVSPNIGHLVVWPNYVVTPEMAVGGGVNNAVNYQGSGMEPPQVLGATYGGRFVSGNGGGYGELAAPASPVSSHVMGLSQVDSGNLYGSEMGMKRKIDGNTEKKVHKRQHRMIKNTTPQTREQKQAYVIELEEELVELRKQNEHLNHLVVKLENKLSQQEEEEGRAKQPYNPSPRKQKRNQQL